MAVLLLTLLGYVAAVALFIYSITLLDADRMLLGLPLLILSIGYWIAGVFLFCGLKVLKPQEALVLTLFDDYIGPHHKVHSEVLLHTLQLLFLLVLKKL